MKKFLLATLVLILCAFAAHAEDAPLREFGEGPTGIGVTIVAGDTEDDVAFVRVHTDKTNLLDALLAVDLIAGENAAWGFNVTTVDAMRADYEGKGEYWHIYAYDEEEGDYLLLETGVGSTPVADEDLFMFVLNQ